MNAKLYTALLILIIALYFACRDTANRQNAKIRELEKKIELTASVVFKK